MNYLILLSFFWVLVPQIGYSEGSHFESCRTNKQSQTEASCQECEKQSLKTLATQIKVQADFKAELAKRVEALIDLQTRKNKIAKQCFENKNPISSLCTDIKRRVKKDVLHNFDSMRMLMAFNKSGVRENSNFTDQDSKFNSKLNHAFTDYARLPDLNDQEVITAKKTYAHAIKNAAESILSENPELNSKIDPEKLKNNYINQLPSYKKYEDGKIKIALSQKLYQFYQNKSKNYYNLLAESPILGYVSTANPSDAELAIGFGKLEEKLKSYSQRIFKEKYRRGQKWVDQDWEEIFGFTHIIEQILKENPSWCAQAEILKKDIEKKKKHDQVFNVAVGFASGVACVAGAEICIAAGLAVGFNGLDKAQTKLENIQASQIVAEKLGEYSQLQDAQKEIWLEKVMLPLAFFGAGKSSIAQIEKVSQKSTTSTLRLESPRFVKIVDPFIDNNLEGPISSKIGLKKLAPNEKGESVYLVPTAPELNKTFNLKESSSLYFISDARSTVPAEEFHRNLSRGRVSISSVDMHDVVDHVAGYLMLSQNGQWERIVNLFQQSYKHTDNPNLNKDIKNKIFNVRADLAEDVEIYTGNISRIERRNDPQNAKLLAKQFKIIEDKIAQYQSKLDAALKQADLEKGEVQSFVQARVTEGKVAEEIKPGTTTYALGIRPLDEAHYSIPTVEKVNKTLGFIMPQSKTKFKETGMVSFEQNRDNWGQGIISYSQNHPHDALEHLPGYFEFLKYPEAELSQKIVQESMELSQANHLDKISKIKANGFANDLMQAIEEYTYRISKADQKGDKEAKKVALSELIDYIQEVNKRLSAFKNQVGKFNLAKRQWERIAPTKLPDEIPYFALGLSDRLQNFTIGMSKKLNHDVFDFGVTASNLNKPKNAKATLNFAVMYTDVGYNEIELMKELVKKSQNKKSILFNLDGIDMSQYSKLDGSLYLPHGQRTNNELKFILENKNIFNHVRWFKNGKELTFEELQKLFGKNHPELFN